jgi:general nucleoside transport system permease protein
MDEAQLASLFASTLRVSTPLILCALAGLLSERSGVIDLGLEGKMLLSAFAAGAAGAVTGSLTLALGTALLVGLAMSMLHGYACVSHRGDQVVLGIALTMTAAGLSIVLGIAWFKQGGQTPPLPDTVRVGPWWLGHNALVYLALSMVPAIWFLLYRTSLGLRLRATGENPAMVDAAGLSVKALRYGALACNGLLCGLAGSYLVLAQGANFSPHMTAGRGYMALAAMIFGKWHPLGALGACILFGFLDAVAIRLQGVPLPPELGGGAVPVQAIQALPYLMTVILLAGFMGHARAPAALGIPYVKER